MKGDSSFVQHRHCAALCSSTGFGIYSYVDLLNSSSTNLNYNIEGSLSQNDGEFCVTYTSFGKMILSSMNYSNRFKSFYIRVSIGFWIYVVSYIVMRVN